MENRLTKYIEDEEPHYHACAEQRSVCDTSDTSRGICLDRGYCLCACGARRNALATCGADWEPAPTELVRMLVLRLNGRMAVILNQAFACAGEFAMGHTEAATLVAESLNRIALEHSEDCDNVRAAMSALIDTLPREFITSMGLEALSSIELNVRATKKKE